MGGSDRRGSALRVSLIGELKLGGRSSEVYSERVSRGRGLVRIETTGERNKPG